jgi:1-acyl-sn-glycerol-3-phosphate acyltransferase
MDQRPSSIKQRPGLWTNLWHAAGLSFWYFIIKFLNRVELRGHANVPQRGECGVMLVYNHISAIDPFAIAVTSMPFFSPVWWRAPAKEELFEIPIIRNIIKTWGGFPVKRGKRDLESIEKMATMLQNSVVVIAPEGTRSTDGTLRRGKAGVGKIIYDAHPRKVIPVKVQGAEAILPKGRILPRIGRKVTITYGSPIDLTAYYLFPESVETSQQIVDVVMEEIAKL